ncbi:MAG: hypothetical protein EOP49_33525 [Sphingobacteriales bacterium]|nr:MAG: hypothetical protein EOP49_33525 [Sphingobacteriales bacterium]
MDIRQFISSGIIEAYVLGVASDDDVRMLETMAAQHPEVAQAIDEAQQTMEDYSMMHAIEPPAGLKDQIWSALAQEGMATEATPQPAAGTPVNNVREFVPAQPPVVKRPYGALAAALALLIGSVVLNFIFWNKQEQNAQDLAAVRTEQCQHVASLQSYIGSASITCCFPIDGRLYAHGVLGYPLESSVPGYEESATGP